MMIFKVETASNGTIVRVVRGSMEAVKVLRELAADGVKCVQWEAAYVD